MTRTIVLEGLSGIAYGPFENDQDLQRWLDAQDRSEGEFNAWELRPPTPPRTVDSRLCVEAGEHRLITRHPRADCPVERPDPHPETEPYVGCTVCHQPGGAAIHNQSLSVADTGEAQHPFVPGAIRT